MTKKQIVALVIGIVVILACAGLAIWLFLMPQEQTAPVSDEKVTYTVQVESASGTPIQNVGVYIYTDETMLELVWFDRTNAQGQMSFTDKNSDSYVAVLSDVPTGYGVEDYYRLTGELTKIVLSAGTMEDADPEEVKYALGDLMMDFSVTTPDGTVYTLSELLKEKRAVVLNFWYIECGPCGLEFPFMQEAYEEYKDQIEILAMNPINQDDEAIAAYQKEKGITFPMAKVDPAWEKMMDLTAYPTTVVIDRFGNITLIHKGMIDKADTFRQLFKYFTADDYEQKAILNIEEIVTEEEGSEDNPLQTGSNGADVTIKAGEEYYLEFYKVSGMYMQVKGEGDDFYVTYKDKKYTPTNGIVGMVVESEGIYYPVKITIGNTSKKDQGFKITFGALKGTLGNPYSMSLGEFSVSTNAGNEQGVYYTYTAENDGVLTVKCLSSSVSKYGFYLYNLRSYAMRNTDEDGKTDEDGHLMVSVAVKKGDPIQFSVAVARDDNNYISAGSFKFLAELGDGTEEEEKKEEKIPYTVMVTDEQDAPMADVPVWLTLVSKAETEEGSTETEDTQEQTKAETFSAKTDAQGKAAFELVKGTYSGRLTLPAGYTLENNAFELTPETATVTVKLQKIVEKKPVEYTVTVVDPNGDPVKDAAVMAVSDTFVTVNTNEQGKAVFSLLEGTYAVKVTAPAGYVVKEGASYQFTEGTFALTVELEFALGSANNPILIEDDNENDNLVTDTLSVSAGTTHYHGYLGGMTMTVTGGVSVTYNGSTYTPENGEVKLTLEPTTGRQPTVFALTNAQEESALCQIKAEYPVGHGMNPQTLTSIDSIVTDFPAGKDSHYYLWTAAEAGVVTVYQAESQPGTAGTEFEVMLFKQGGVASPTMSESEDGKHVEMNVVAGDVVKIVVTSLPDENWDYPARTVALTGTFQRVELAKEVYNVNILDQNGAAYTGQVTVKILGVGGTVVFEKETAVGAVSTELEPGNYTVELVLTDDTLEYDTASAVLTETNKTANISLKEKTIYQDYTVNITDEQNAPYTKSVEVKILNAGGTAVYSGIVTTGTVTKTLEQGSYTVVLTYADNTLIYDAAAAVLTPEQPTLTVQLKAKTVNVNYGVAVVDAEGKPVSEVKVVFTDKDGIPVTSELGVDAEGKIFAKLESADYQVKLNFTDTALTYDAYAAKVTPTQPEVTVVAATKFVPAGEPETFSEQGYYPVAAGATYVPVSKNEANYGVYNNEEYCFFYVTVTEAGEFTVTTSNKDAQIANFGSNPFFIFNATTEEEKQANAFKVEVAGDRIESSGEATFFLAIKVNEAIDGTTLLIAKNDITMDEQDYRAAWIEWKPSTPAPAITRQEGSEVWEPVSSSAVYKLPAGKTLTAFDYKQLSSYTLVKGSDGYYHLNTADGPLVYVNFKSSAMDIRAMLDAGNPFRRIFYNADSTPQVIEVADGYLSYDENGVIVYDENGKYAYNKQEYTMTFMAYVVHADATYNVYPLNDDLIYMLQNGGAYKGWYTYGGANYLFKDKDENQILVPEDLAWMFALSYAQ